MVLQRCSSVVTFSVFQQMDFSVALVNNIAHRKYFIDAFKLLITFLSYCK